MSEPANKYSKKHGPITWPSPAKLNLFLYINARRPDGYHELQTLFQFLNYGDELEISSNESGEIRLDVAGHEALAQVPMEDNLIVQAALALQAKAKQKQANFNLGAEIKIHKILPMGGGLGGGSSNAATTLVALNYQWSVGLSMEELAELGLKLGADVPVFIFAHSAFAEGVGEVLKKVEPKEYAYLVLIPEAAISTAELFNAPELPRNTPKRTWECLNNSEWSNDCEKIACKLYPEIGNRLKWLLEYAPSRMTGTGSCIFAQFDSIAEAKKIQDLLPSGVNAFVAQGCNVSPLLTKLAEFDACI